jgi:CheY-like chemotaxis protein
MAQILIIDDDKELVECNKLILETHGHKVSTAYSSEEGWSRLMESRPDLVILDCIMEEFTSGFTLAHDINHKFPNLPILLLTSIQEQMNVDWKFGEEDKGWLPVHKLLQKPIPADRLIEEIDGLLKTTAV